MKRRRCHEESTLILPCSYTLVLCRPTYTHCSLCVTACTLGPLYLHIWSFVPTHLVLCAYTLCTLRIHTWPSVDIHLVLCIYTLVLCVYTLVLCQCSLKPSSKLSHHFLPAICCFQNWEIKLLHLSFHFPGWLYFSLPTNYSESQQEVVFSQNALTLRCIVQAGRQPVALRMSAASDVSATSAFELAASTRDLMVFARWPPCFFIMSQ